MPICVRCEVGLSNRLIVAFSYLREAERLNDNLFVVWQKNKFCNGYFNDYFEVPSRMNLINDPIYNIDYHGSKCHENFHCYNDVSVFKDLQLLPFMLDKVINIKEKLKDYISVHIRRTDHQGYGKITPDEGFIQFLEKYPDYPIFLATDNYATQLKFKEIYGDRLYYGTKIDVFSKELRTTSLENAIIDMFVCKESRYFLGSYYSSFSGIINALRKRDNMEVISLKEYAVVNTSNHSKRCVVSLGINSVSKEMSCHSTKDYNSKLRSLEESFKIQQDNFIGHFIKWDRDFPYNIVPEKYGYCCFKPFCFQEALDLGYKKILWIDANVIIYDINSAFERLENIGYYVCQGFEYVGEYCRDSALEPLGISREESFTLPSCWSAVIGFDFNRSICLEFLRLWKEQVLKGAFIGDKLSGIRGYPVKDEISKDSRVHGHGHDQTVASVLLLKLGMDNWIARNEHIKFFVKRR